MAVTARAYKNQYYAMPKSRPKTSSGRNRRNQVVQKSAFLVIALLSLVTLTRLVQEVVHAQTLTLINQNKTEIEQAHKQKEELQLKLGLMKAPGRINSIAVNKLGMVETKKAGYLLVPKVAHKPKNNSISKKAKPQLASILGSVFP